MRGWSGRCAPAHRASRTGAGARHEGDGGQGQEWRAHRATSRRVPLGSRHTRALGRPTEVARRSRVAPPVRRRAAHSTAVAPRWFPGLRREAAPPLADSPGPRRAGSGSARSRPTPTAPRPRSGRSGPATPGPSARRARPVRRGGTWPPPAR